VEQALESWHAMLEYRLIAAVDALLILTTAMLLAVRKLKLRSHEGRFRASSPANATSPKAATTNFDFVAACPTGLAYCCGAC
jgi:hypothetical protein